MPVWTHFPTSDFEKRFLSVKSDNWSVSEDRTEFSEKNLSENEILDRKYRFGGDQSRRLQTKIEE